MRYKNENVTTAKKMLVSRLSYIISRRLDTSSETGSGLAGSIGMSPNIISKLRRGIDKGISFEAILEAARRLNIRYTLTMQHYGNRREEVKLTMEDIKSSQVKSLNLHSGGYHTDASISGRH